MKGQNGITLVALIITIIVLLILAVVSIGALTDSNLLPKSKKAVENYSQSVTAENGTLQSYTNYLGNYVE